MDRLAALGMRTACVEVSLYAHHVGRDCCCGALVVRRFALPPTRSAWLRVGCLALGLVLLMECTVVLWLQGLTIRASLAHRDPVAATAYAVSLVVFSVMPLLVARTTY